MSAKKKPEELTAEAFANPFESGLIEVVEIEWLGRQTYVRRLSLDAQEHVNEWAKEELAAEGADDQENETVDGSLQSTRMKVLIGMVLCNAQGELLFPSPDNPTVCDPDKVLAAFGKVDGDKVLDVFEKISEINGTKILDEVKE